MQAHPWTRSVTASKNDALRRHCRKHRMAAQQTQKRQYSNSNTVPFSVALSPLPHQRESVDASGYNVSAVNSTLAAATTVEERGKAGDQDFAASNQDFEENLKNMRSQMKQNRQHHQLKGIELEADDDSAEPHLN